MVRGVLVQVDNDAGGAVKKLAILFLVEHVLFFIWCVPATETHVLCS